MNSPDLFSSAAADKKFYSAPLAHRMRPTNLDEFIGQEHILSKGKLLRRLIESDQIQSVIFFGPPGTGKTTLARIIASQTQSRFVPLNAVEAKTSDVRAVIEEAKKTWDYYRQKTILFVDEIHRFNKLLCLFKDKGVANGATANHHPIRSGLGKHRHGIFG